MRFTSGHFALHSLLPGIKLQVEHTSIIPKECLQCNADKTNGPIFFRRNQSNTQSGSFSHIGIPSNRHFSERGKPPFSRELRCLRGPSATTSSPFHLKSIHSRQGIFRPDEVRAIEHTRQRSVSEQRVWLKKLPVVRLCPIAVASLPRSRIAVIHSLFAPRHRPNGATGGAQVFAKRTTSRIFRQY
jgi:hypothetical protein